MHTLTFEEHALNIDGKVNKALEYDTHVFVSIN
jgi:hypothetical protein